MNNPFRTQSSWLILIFLYCSAMNLLVGCDGRRCWSNTREFELTAGFSSIWTCCGNTAYSVGDPGVYKLDGDSWTRGLSPSSSAYITDIWGNSSDNVYVVTSGGILYHFNGEEWEEFNYFPGSQLDSVWGVDNNTLFISGQRDEKGIIFTFSGGVWQEYLTDTSRLLSDVWACSDTEAIAVGNKIFQYNGIEWQEAKLGLSQPVFSVWGTSCNDYYLSGNNIYHLVDGVLVDEYIGKASGFRNIWGRSSNDVFAVGPSGNAVHYDGVEWVDISLKSDIDLEAVGGFHEGKVYAVGSAFFGIESHGVIQEYTCE